MSDAHVTAIPLRGKYGEGRSTLVDPDVYAWAKHFAWFCFRNGYVFTTTGGQAKTLHRILMGEPEGFDVDHVNRDRLDNRRANLRLATRSQNSANRLRSKAPGASKYKGVRCGRYGNWFAQITVAYRTLYLGTHPTEEDAARAYDAAARLHFGEFARTNFPA